MATPRDTTPLGQIESVDSDLERQLDDLDDLDDDDDFEWLEGVGVPDELERLGGFSESTSSEDPPPE
jgi:hypothetical protein